MASGDASSHERTEQPTGKRREEARRQGQVAKSADLTAALLLLGALGVQSMSGAGIFSESVDVLRRGFLNMPAGDLTPDLALTLFRDAAVTLIRLVWPLVAIPAAIAVAAQLLQTRFALSPAALRPQWSRLSPTQGLARLLGMRGVVDLLKAILKLALVGAVAVATLRADWSVLMHAGQGGVESAFGAIASVVFRLWLGIGGSYLALAAFDYGWQWWQHEKSLRMTREELRQESKDTEGSPQLRGRIRALHRQRATKRLVEQVKKADVVVRNPTHVAVALRYESGAMGAPRVVAKGAEALARRIIAIATQHGVPVVENRPLARSLYRLVKEGREIPQDLYRAVAEVLAYVYALRRGGR